MNMIEGWWMDRLQFEGYDKRLPLKIWRSAGWAECMEFDLAKGKG